MLKPIVFQRKLLTGKLIYISNHSYFYIYVSYRVFNCILVHFIPLYLTLSFTSFYSFTGIYTLLILFLYSILSTLFPCTLYGLILLIHFLYSILFLSTLFPCCTLYRRGWDYTAWSVFVQMSCLYLVYASL